MNISVNEASWPCHRAELTIASIHPAGVEQAPIHDAHSRFALALERS